MLAVAPLIATFTAAWHIFASTGGALQDLTDRTGLSAETLSFLSFAADQTGTDLVRSKRRAKSYRKTESTRSVLPTS